ncbi:MAG: HAD-IA family hydrolase [Arenicellales bacterium]|nr:HAD-IA family hydrolase [Arenicellales bacterium]
MNHVIAQTLLLDLDGTLADTAPDLIAALNTVLAENDRPPVALTKGRFWVASGSVGMIRTAFDLTEDAARASPLRHRLLALYSENICVQTRLFPGMEALLRQADADGLSWGVVTNKPARFTEPLLEALGLARRAAVIVCGDTVACPKPDPMPLLYACKQTGSSASSTLFAGDDLRDIQAGRAAGMATAAVTWGYSHAAEISAWGAEHVVGDPGELLHPKLWTRPAT